MTKVAIDDDVAVGEVNNACMCLTSRAWTNSAQISKEKSNQPPEDIKEILLYGKVGYTTSIEISFKNKRNRSTTIKAKAILNRFEPQFSNNKNVTPQHTFKAIIVNEGKEVADVSIAPQTNVHVTIEFSPTIEGIYSGVLKIRSKNKVRILHLIFKYILCFCLGICITP